MKDRNRAQNGIAGTVRNVRLLICALLCILFISQPASAAVYNYPYPQADSKKGLSVAPGMEEDAMELGVRNSIINIDLAQLFAAPSEQNRAAAIPATYKGRTYWFRAAAVGSYDASLRRLRENNTVVTGILLLSYRADLAGLISPSALMRKGSGRQYYYMWNTRSQDARDMLAAAVRFLALRYGAENGANGRIVGWILGNEVNNYSDWNYDGRVTFDQYMNDYADAFALLSKNARAVYRNARIYISLDHYWTQEGKTYYAGKDVLDAFAKRVSAKGLRWNLAYHPYNRDQLDPRLWAADPDETQSVKTPVIAMQNLTVLTDYVKSHFGRKVRIILSEQGYSSQFAGQQMEASQEASIAYAYYLADSNDMVDAIILHRQVDHSEEKKAGAMFGLWTSSGSGENADSRKPSWETFRTMDTSSYGQSSERALQTIGASSWSDLIPGYDVRESTSHISLQEAGGAAGTDDSSGAVIQVYSSADGKAARVRRLPTGWKRYGAVVQARWKDGTYTLVRDSSRNTNIAWGLNRDFGHLNVSKYPRLTFRIFTTGTTNGRSRVLVRIFSGRRRCIEYRRVYNTGVWRDISVDLSDWKYRKSVTRVQILLQNAEDGAWLDGAAMTVADVAFR